MAIPEKTGIRTAKPLETESSAREEIRNTESSAYMVEDSCPSISLLENFVLMTG